jgi:NAD(P)-dependent dehydrogenase (short-subunit alcohol dehydrogenase family)
MTQRLAGKTALITGGSRGIGLAVAEAFAAEGAALLINARSPGPLAEAAGALSRKFGVKVDTFACDVTDRASVEKMAAQAETAGGIDVLVNNAGIHRARSFLNYTAQDFRDLFEVNFKNRIAECHKYFILVPDQFPCGCNSMRRPLTGFLANEGGVQVRIGLLYKTLDFIAEITDNKNEVGKSG